MTEQQHREAHEAFIKRLDALDRQYAPDAPESPEEAECNEKRMREVLNGSPDTTDSENLPFSQ